MNQGQTYESFDYESIGTKMVCNPKGYLLRNSLENPSFEESTIVAISLGKRVNLSQIHLALQKTIWCKI